MIQQYQRLKFHIEEYNKGSKSSQADGEAKFGQIQKAFGTCHFICLVIRYPGKTRYLYIGRGNTYEGIWEHDKPPPSPLRVKDRFLEYIRKHLVGSKVSHLDIDPKDRILVIPLKGKDRKALFALFWKGRQSYFSYAIQGQDQNEIFCSWQKSGQALSKEENLEERVLNSFDPVGRKKIDLKEIKSYELKNELNQYLERESESLKKVPGGKRKRKYFQRKILNIENDLDKVQRWQKLKEIIESDNFSFGQDYKQKIAEINFKFPFQSTDYQKRDLVYSKIRAFRKAESLLTNRLKKAKEEFKNWEDGVHSEYGEEHPPRSKIISPIWAKAKESDNRHKNLQSGKEASFVEFDFSLSAGSSIRGAIGKNTHANDYLRIKWASKKNFWFHLEDMKSGHCILKLDDLSSFQNDDFEVLGSLLRDFAGFEIREIPLVFTQVKNLKGVKGQAGAVLYKKAKFRKVNYRKDWKEIISLN